MGQCCVIEYIIGRRKEASERVVGCTMEYGLGWNTISKVSRSLWQVIDCPRTNPPYSTCLTNGRPTVFYRRTHLSYKPAIVLHRWADTGRRSLYYHPGQLTTIQWRKVTTIQWTKFTTIHGCSSLDHIICCPQSLLKQTSSSHWCYCFVIKLCCISVAHLVLLYFKSPIAPSVSNLLHLTFTWAKVSDLTAACIEMHIGVHALILQHRAVLWFSLIYKDKWHKVHCILMDTMQHSAGYFSVHLYTK